MDTAPQRKNLQRSFRLAPEVCFSKREDAPDFLLGDILSTKQERTYTILGIY